MNGTTPRWWPQKAPDADLDYSYDTTADLAGLDDAILSVSAAVMPSGATELSIANLIFAAPLITIWLAGGVPGRIYTIKITAPTQAGRTFEWLFLIRIDPTLAEPPLPSPPSLGFGAIVTVEATV